MKWKEIVKIESTGCCHKKRNVVSSNCSHCKITMMAMPKKIIKNYKSKDKHVSW